MAGSFKHSLAHYLLLQIAVLNLFQRIPTYIKIYPDAMEITDLRNGRAIRRTATKKFSSSRMLVADFGAAEDLIQKTLQELGIAKKTLKIVLQQMEDLGGGICECEKRNLRDLGEHAGGIYSLVAPHVNPMTSDEALAFLKAGG